LAGLKNAEIARILGRSHDAIRKEQSRIVKTLRVLVGQQAEQGVLHV
jgi:DNA-directed RNA polymerase specialized sigma24 family protein